MMARAPRRPRAADIEKSYPTIIGALILAVIFLVWREAARQAGAHRAVPPQATGGL